MKSTVKITFSIAWLILATACATYPIPTATMPRALPTARPSTTLTPLPTSTTTPSPSSTATLAPTPTPTLVPTPVAYSRNPRALLIEAEVWGGPDSAPRDAHVPAFRLYADGLVVFAGERASLSTGLDATVRIGRLVDAQIQDLFASLHQVGFFDLKESYEPRPKPFDAPTTRISVYLNTTKTVRVYAPNDPSTPPAFTDAFNRIKLSLPVDAQTFIPTDAHLEATDAGAATNVATKERILDWQIAGVRLADAVGGVTVSGRTYEQIAALRARQPNVSLYREGDRIYRVRFAPNLPRAVQLTDWLGTILNAPREFDGRTFEIVGYFRGWNLLGEARGNPPVTRSDWVITDSSDSMYVTGIAPSGLVASSREDIWNVVRLTARVVYVRLGTSYLEARRVENLTPKSSATPNANSATDAAIALVKATFPKVAHIKSTPPGLIGASTNITVVLPRQDASYLVFWEGWGDCPAGCINNRYYYFVVKDGVATQAGEYARIYDEAKNNFETTGAPLWGVPR